MSIALILAIVAVVALAFLYYREGQKSDKLEESIKKHHDQWPAYGLPQDTMDKLIADLNRDLWNSIGL